MSEELKEKNGAAEVGSPDLFDRLVDPDNDDPIVLFDEEGNRVVFEQVAVVPMDTADGQQMFVILHPTEGMEQVGEEEAIVFRADYSDDGEFVLLIEGDNAVAEQVFEKYLACVEE